MPIHTLRRLYGGMTLIGSKPKPLQRLSSRYPLFVCHDVCLLLNNW